MTTTVSVPKLVTAAEVCGLLYCSYPTLAKLVRDGEFPAPLPFKPGQGRRRLWRAADVKAALERKAQ